MKKSVILAVALALATLAGSSGAVLAQGQERYRNDNQEWRNDRGEWRDGDYRNDDYRNDDYRNDGYGNRGNRVGAFTGTWRLDERRNRQGWSGGFASLFTRLPSVIRIERDRRELRVENARGGLLREIDLRGGDARDGRFQVVSNGSGGTRVVETFTLRERGRELVVHTTVHGRRGQATRQFTSIYDRA